MDDSFTLGRLVAAAARLCATHPAAINMPVAFLLEDAELQEAVEARMLRGGEGSTLSLHPRYLGVAESVGGAEDGYELVALTMSMGDEEKES